MTQERRQYMREYRKAHTEQIKQIHKTYYKKNTKKCICRYMTWENYGRNGWHIDHKIPLSRFDLTNRQQFLIANHYTNLQPMWGKDNISKHDFHVLDFREGVF